LFTNNYHYQYLLPIFTAIIITIILYYYLLQYLLPLLTTIFTTVII